MYTSNFPHRRYKKTLQFLKHHLPTDSNILDLGVDNPFAVIMKENGYRVTNTKGEDLDFDIDAVKQEQYDAVTAFQILEHLVAPLNVLKAIKTGKLVTSIPLRLWFSSAYKNNNNTRDRHYHEFEDWQFDWLLEKAGWKIIARKKWTNPVRKIGFRPILRLFTPRYYIVYAEKK